ncbi:competence type IV pilus minor pilin ComGD [Halalkalibacter alkalisediminis]|uniref:Competence type IV pilus minor pilin ComGD n=1 Tax=Halalkalibacter alkalisediminis TaxID=935616 RepID=A0ABV6NNF2_9BACI|nr:competence type IV pilus minor pilin ComGD [Halalkalibacter alkalisediminis]
MKDSNSGYTLIELLITLSLLSILISLPLVNFPKLHATSQEADIIAKQVQDTLILAQQVAMSTGRATQIRADNSMKELTIRFAPYDDYSVTPYQHPDMTLELLTISPSSIAFLANGHPSRSGTFLLRIGSHRYRFTVYLGKGMITYTKL